MHHRHFTAALLLFVLTGCSGQGAKTDMAVHGATDAVEVPMVLSHENLAVMTALPSALFGTFAGAHLAHDATFAYHTALVGLDAQMLILYGGQQQDDTMGLVESLGSALQVDVFDLLNRSSDRNRTLSEYLMTLQNLIQAGENQMLALKSQRDAINDQRATKRRASSDIQHDLNKALRDKDYSTAGTKQEELVQAEKELGDVDAQSHRLQNMMDILEELLNVGHERYVAIDVNQSALISGVHVVQVPGVDTIGVLQTSSKSSHRNFFDPNARR